MSIWRSSPKTIYADQRALSLAKWRNIARIGLAQAFTIFDHCVGSFLQFSFFALRVARIQRESNNRGQSKTRQSFRPTFLSTRAQRVCDA